MKKSLYLCLLLMVQLGCKSENEKHIDRLTGAIREHIENHSFKQNQKVSLLEISEVSYKEVGQSSVDSLRIQAIRNRCEQLLGLSKEHSAAMHEAMNSMYLAKQAGDGDLFQKYSSESQDELLKVILYGDTVKILLAEDSVLSSRLKKAEANKSTYYKTRFFCKATIGEKNVLDTFNLLFDKNYKVVQTE